jgi:hypothetical protein
MDQVVIKGNLCLEGYSACGVDPIGGGYSSGGYLSNSVVDGEIFSVSQQQWLCLNSTFAKWNTAVWNQVSVGCKGYVNGNEECIQNNGMFTVVEKTPVYAPKPYLFMDADNNYAIMCPDVQHDQSGPVVGKGTVIPMTQCFVADPSMNTKTLNLALNQGLHLILTPGVYSLDCPLMVSGANQVVLGLGVATLIPTTDQPAMIVSGAGVRLAGILFDAGVNNASALLRIDGQGSKDKPTILNNIVGRVGGINDAAQAVTMLEVNQDYVIGVNVWLWRADHNKAGVGEGLGSDKAKCDHGLVVTANDVSFYGLFVEHMQKELVLWDGNRGSIYFMQSELPYDVTKDYDYPALKIGDSVDTFFGLGIGIYCFFPNKEKTGYPTVSTAIKCPTDKPGVVIQNACTRFLNGGGGIQHIINDKGPACTIDNRGPYWCSVNSDVCPKT